jgi:hypothetical protein
MALVDADLYLQTQAITPALWNLVAILVEAIMYLQMVMQSSLSLIQQSTQTTSYGVRAITQQVNKY